MSDLSDTDDEELAMETLEANEPNCSPERKEWIRTKNARRNEKKRAMKAKTYGETGAGSTASGVKKTEKAKNDKNEKTDKPKK